MMSTSNTFSEFIANTLSTAVVASLFLHKIQIIILSETYAREYVIL